MSSYLENIIQNSINNTYSSSVNIDNNTNIDQSNILVIDVINSENVNINIAQENTSQLQNNFVVYQQQLNSQETYIEQSQAATQQLISDAVAESTASASGFLSTAISQCNTNVDQSIVLNMINKTINNYVNSINQKSCALNKSDIEQLNDYTQRIIDSKDINVQVSQINSANQQFHADITSDMENTIDFVAKQSQESLQEGKASAVSTSTAEATGISIGGVLSIVIIAFAIVLVVKGVGKGIGKTAQSISDAQTQQVADENGCIPDIPARRQGQNLATITLVLAIICSICIILVVVFIIYYTKTLNGEAYQLKYDEYINNTMQKFMNEGAYSVNFNTSTNCICNINLGSEINPSIIYNPLISKHYADIINGKDYTSIDENKAIAYNNMCYAIKNISSSDIKFLNKQQQTQINGIPQTRGNSATEQYIYISWQDNTINGTTRSNNGITFSSSWNLPQTQQTEIDVVGYMTNEYVYLQVQLSIDNNTKVIKLDSYNPTFIKDISSCNLYGVLFKLDSGWEGELSGLISNNNHIAKYLKYNYMDESHTINKFIEETIYDNYLINTNGLNTVVSGSEVSGSKGGACLQVYVPQFYAYCNGQYKPLSRDNFKKTSATEYTTKTTIEPYKIYYNKLKTIDNIQQSLKDDVYGFGTSTDSDRFLISDNILPTQLIVKDANGDTKLSFSDKQIHYKTTDYIYPFPFSDYTNFDSSDDYAYFWYYDESGNLWKCYIQMTTVNIYTTSITTTYSTGYWFWEKEHNKEYVYLSDKQTNKPLKSGNTNYQYYNVSNQTTDIPLQLEKNLTALTYGQKNEYIYPWPQFSDNFDNDGIVYVKQSTSEQIVIPVVIQTEGTIIKNMGGYTFSENHEFYSIWENSSGEQYIYPKYDGSTLIKYQFSQSDIEYIKDYFRNLDYHGLDYTECYYLLQVYMQQVLIKTIRNTSKKTYQQYNEVDEDEDYTISDEKVLEYILTDKANYNETNLKEYISQYNSSLTDLQKSQGYEVMPDDFSLSNIMISFNSGLYESTTDIWSNGIDCIKPPFVRALVIDKLGFKGKEYYISEDDYNNCYVNNYYKGINTIILQRNDIVNQDYEKIQKELQEQYDYYTKLYKNLSIGFGVPGAIFLVATVLTGVYSSKKLKACVKQ